MRLSHAFRPLGYVSALALLAGCMSVREEAVVAAPEPAPEVSGVYGGDVIVAEPAYEAEVVAESPPSGSYAGIARRGVVTAGDIDDLLNLAAFTRYVKRAGGSLGLPQLGLGAPVLVRQLG